MSIVSLKFFIFVLFLFIIYWLTNNKYRWIVLLIGNYIFYFTQSNKYTFLLLLITILSFFFGFILDRNKSKALLTLGIVSCSSLLIIFKYSNYLITTINSITNNDINIINTILPIGISFYTFEAISYIVDVFKGQSCEKHFGYYACYLSFFPTITSGPIERSKSIIDQFKQEKIFESQNGFYSLKLITVGLFKKIVIADNIAAIINPIFDNCNKYRGLVLIVVVILFAIQIYLDFSGYSDMAKGIAGLFGINLIDNFKQPYFSTTVKEFWSKWHISLSTWLKDYIYIPLGGNRCNKTKHLLNLLITFVVSGIWHGANVTFLIWGLLHGLLQIIENVFNIKPISKTWSIKWWLRCILLFIVLCITWVFFRANSLNDALYILNPVNSLYGISNPISWVMDTISNLNIDRYMILSLGLNVAALFVYDLYSTRIDLLKVLDKQKTFIKYLIYVSIILIILASKSTIGVSFVYDKF